MSSASILDLLTSPTRHKSPTWKTRAVRHSGVRTQRQISKRAAPSTPAYIPFASHRSLPANMPKTRGHRLHLELLS